MCSQAILIFHRLIILNYRVYHKLPGIPEPLNSKLYTLGHFPTAQFGRSLSDAFEGFDFIEELVNVFRPEDEFYCPIMCKNYQYKRKSNLLGSFLGYVQLGPSKNSDLSFYKAK